MEATLTGRFFFLPAILSSPSTKTALLVDGPISAHTPPFRPSVPKNRHFSELTRHLHLDLPCQGPFLRKVGAFSGGPSMPGAIFPEGRRFFRGTFHASGRFPGRSCVFQGDLPCQSPFSWKVLPFSGGPSTPEAIFPEGPAFFRGTFHARSHFPGRSLSKCSWSALLRDTWNEKRSFCSWSTLFRDTWSSEALDSRDAATEPKHL